ncbi:MAG: hypothetical protein LBU89_11865 [Fibromonadaceae bacterium]|nr:hypothetical protein [Fibromonadaceae bacterium]
MRVRSQSMIKATETANATVAILKEDLGRMGAKVWKKENLAEFIVDENVYRNPSAGDNSSFHLIRSGDGEYDEIFFNTIDYSPNGELLAVREINYRVNADQELERLCRTLSPDTAANDECPDEWSLPTIMATNVEFFSLNPSIPGIRQDGGLAASVNAASKPAFLFPTTTDPNFAPFSFVPRAAGGKILPLNVDPNPNNTSVTLRGFTKNGTNSSNYSQVFLAEPGTGACKEISLIPGEVYAIEFNMSHPIPADPNEKCYMCTFQPGEDHIAIGLRTGINDTKIAGVPDFAVFPSPVISSASNPVPPNRYQEFSVPKESYASDLEVTACISFTFAFYSAFASGGELSFANFKVYRKIDEVYHFAIGNDAYTYNPGITSSTVTGKAEVKAFELEFGVKIRDEIVKTKTVIPVQNNGIVAASTT